MKILPILYKKTSTGAIQYWNIETISRSTIRGGVGDIITKYGQLDTTSPQETIDTITEGKNLGKINATTPIEQAMLEAQAKWEKQKKKGYVETVAGAEAGELDNIIEGGVVPMLAHKFSEQAHKITYPAFVQPKLDGIRCIAILKDGKVTLWSRTRKRITSMPHIVAELEYRLRDFEDLIMDGELYNHKYKTNFEKIVSLIRQEEPDPEHKIVEYHVYDFVFDIPFKERARALNEYRTMGFESIKFVVTEEVYNEEEVTTYFNVYKELGYEGCIVRNAQSEYVNKRSYDLLKVKEFDEEEYKILGIEEGRGKLAGHVGAFVCQDSSGRTFLAKARGATETLRTYFNNPETWQGKKITVQFQGLTGKNGVPRFPVGKAIRDYE